MKWIELIRTRSCEAILSAALPALEQQVRNIEASVPGAETFFLKHALYDGDLAVVVVWRNEVAPHKSREGLLVAEQLQRLGSVEHAVWIPAAREHISDVTP
ncbi:MAG: hypothetical protein AAF560_13130 [Acidobacteriota bacterium]